VRTTAMERQVRRESHKLLRDTRKVLRRFAYKIPDDISEKVQRRVVALERALRAGDSTAMRVELFKLDRMADKHLSFARKSTMREYAESIGIAVLIALFLRAFVVEAFKIPSGSMIPTMEIGDHIFVNKFIYGVRIPYTTTKFFGFREPQRGEVIVFINPCEPDKDFIKRVVAVAGDTVEVRCGVLLINGKEVPAVPIEGPAAYWDYDEGSGIWQRGEGSAYQETLGGHAYVTMHELGRPGYLSRVAQNPAIAFHGTLRHRDFPGNEPPSCRGEGIFSDLYGQDDRSQVLGEIEPSEPEASEHEGPCAPVRRYVVPAGHVFVMGDNRHNSSDSRKWGSVPIENIKGKALFIWWSRKPSGQGGVAWERLGNVVQ
jgi:signal peptidase I